MSTNNEPRQNKSKSPLTLFFRNHDITYKSWDKYFASFRGFYNRIAKPESLLLVEAIKIAKDRNITLDELQGELEKLGMKFL